MIQCLRFRAYARPLVGSVGLPQKQRSQLQTKEPASSHRNTHTMICLGNALMVVKDYAAWPCMSDI